ncbi:hypothetical protein GLOTRDRAFT_54228 [Gloeophyllum trabeum ATCC 11539]|uniref:Uncharacterized protein n=1 Tax=Gloeophyllum trabeum (strain ATCC 11539 / FP-39264 / Madison 617) TaxID=670483 RepID=S7QP58_GLOTA|nr:uncharacterized protein GLOTRDRAFT_54228 [Gloeophyllum trabeum ATCC 11539]EPQ61313.1 hypothetical protein GLOTRDRAFT_54228 [Gloeophyllum trabeum ATCC 11539]
MARRSAPPGSGPAYMAPHGAVRIGGRPHHDPDESAFSRFMREQIFAPEKLPGNINIATAVSLFGFGIFAVRTWGDLLLPA